MITIYQAGLWALGDVVAACSLLTLAVMMRRGRRLQPDLITPRILWTFGGLHVLMGLGLLLDAVGLVWPAVWEVRVAWGLLLAGWAAGAVVISVARQHDLAGIVSPPRRAVAVAALAAGDVSAALSALGETPTGGVERPAYPSARQVRRLLADSPIGLCLIDRQGRIEHIEGGALRFAGTSVGEWTGRLVEEPWLSHGVTPALAGKVAAFGEVDPVKGERGQLLVYAPRHNGRGEVVGVVCWWVVLGIGQLIDVDEGVSDHGWSSYG